MAAGVDDRAGAGAGLVTAPLVPGYTLRGRIGSGAHGSVWLATDRASGEDVAVKVAPGPGAADGGATEREIALLRRIDHPHVVRLRRVVEPVGGGLAMVLDHARGGDLNALLARRGRLEPGETTTMLVPLARALEHLHGRGLVHGDLSPGNVLFTPEGRPLLADLGASRVLGRTAEAWATPGFGDPALALRSPGGPDAPSDVWSLAALAWYALTGSPPPVRPGLHVPLDGSGRPAGPAVLTALLAACLDADASRRPSPGELAYRAWDAVRPIPIRLLPADPDADAAAPVLDDVTQRVRAAAALPDPGPAPRRRRPVLRRRGTADLATDDAGGRSPFADPAPVASRWSVTRRWWPAAAVAAVALTGAGVLLVGPWAPGGGPEPVTAGAPTAPGWAGIVRDLGERRAAALTAGSVEGLGEVDAPGSPALVADRALLERLAAAGVRLDGLGFTVGDVRLLKEEPGSARVSAEVTTSAHRQEGNDGSSLPVAADEGRPVTLDLTRSRNGEWLVAQVT